MPITIGKLSAILTLNSSKFTSGMRGATKTLSGFANNIAGSIGKVAAFGGAVAGVAGIGSLGFMLRSTMDNIDATTKFADRLGIATEQLAGLHHAAAISGVSTQNLNLGLQRMTRRVAEAAGGTGEAVKALEELGLDAKLLASLAPDKQFMAIADAMQSVNSQSDKVRLAFKLFDSEGVALLNTLRAGSAQLQQTIREAERLGLTFNRIEAKRIEEANDAITRTKGAVQGLVNELAIGLAPAIEAASDKLRVVTDAINDVVNQWDVFKAAATLSLLETSLAVSEFADYVINAVANIGVPVENTMRAIAVIASNLFGPQTFGRLISDFAEIFTTTFQNLQTVAQNLATNLVNFFSAAFKAIKTGSLDPLADLTFKSLTDGTNQIVEPVLDVLAALTKGVGESQIDFRGLTEDSPITSALKTAVEQAQIDLKRAIEAGSQAGGDTGGGAGGDATATTGTGATGPQFAGALVRGSTAEYSARIKAIGAGARDDDAKKTAENTEKTVSTLEAVRSLIADRLRPSNSVEVVSI